MTRLASRLNDGCSIRVLAVSALALTSTLLAATGDVSYTDSDPRGTLLTAQAILEHGSFALDAYPDLPSDHRIVQRSGHRFYAYPPGTPLAALPAVAIARLAGYDMVRWQDDEAVQRAVAALSVGVTAVLAALLAFRWLPWPLAATLAAIFVFGTPVMSTMGTALWSTNLTVVIALFALLLLSKFDARGRPFLAAAIGALLGFAFWCRPPAFVIAGLTIVWIFVRAVRSPSPERRSAFISALALAAVVIASPTLLVVMSRLAYGSWLPDYYAGARVAASDRFGTAVFAHLVSPSRGLLIFAPVAAFAIAGTVLAPRRVLRFPLAVLASAWIGVHLAIVSRFPHWWGGYSYGSRLMVDVLPGVFVLSCAVAAVVRNSRPLRVPGLVVLIFAGACGIWINSVQGLFNPATKAWNASPNIDHFPGYAFDWQAPQFLATDAQLEKRLRRHDRWLRAPLEPTVDYSPGSTRLEFSDWLPVETVGGSVIRRSAGQAPSLRFLVSEDSFRGAGRMMLTLGIGSERPIAGDVWFNGQPTAHLTIRTAEPEYYVVAIPRELVRTIEYDVLTSNVLEWRSRPDGEKTRILLWTLRVHAGRRNSS